MNVVPKTAKGFELSLILVVAISAFAINVAVPAVPQAITVLGGGIKDGHYITASYVLGYAFGHIPCGLIADRFGRRATMLGFLGLFIIGGLLTSVAPAIEVMLIARFFQGFGGAVGPVVSRAIARDVAKGPELSRLMSVFVNTLAFVPLLSPLIGSGLLISFGWRGPFAISFILGVMTVVAVWYYVPETLSKTNTGTVTAKYIMSRIRGFFTNGINLWGAMIIMFLFLGYLAIISSIAPVLHDVYGYDDAAIGFIIALIILPYAISASINRLLARRYASTIVLGYGVGFFLLAAGGAFGALLEGEASFLFLVLIIVAFLIGMGLVFSHAMVAAMTEQEASAGLAAGIIGTIQMLAGALGGGLAAAFYNQTVWSLLSILACAASGIVIAYIIGQLRSWTQSG